MDCCGNCKNIFEDYDGQFCDFFIEQPPVQLNKYCENHKSITEIEMFDLTDLTIKE